MASFNPTVSGGYTPIFERPVTSVIGGGDNLTGSLVEYVNITGTSGYVELLEFKNVDTINTLTLNLTIDGVTSTSTIEMDRSGNERGFHTMTFDSSNGIAFNDSIKIKCLGTGISMKYIVRTYE